jgi:hypothetical protein
MEEVLVLWDELLGSLEPALLSLLLSEFCFFVYL